MLKSMKTKFKLTKTKTVSLTGGLLVIAVAVIFSIMSIVVDYENVGTKTWWSNLLILYGLMVLAIFVSIMSTSLNDKANEKSERQIALETLRNDNREVQRRQLGKPLCLYCNKVNFDARKKFINDTIDENELDVKYKDFSKWNVKDIEQELKEEKITKYQFTILKALRLGNFYVEDVTREKLKVSFAKKTKTKYESHKFKISMYHAISKLGTTFVIAIAIASVAKSSMYSDASTIIFNLVMRLCAVASSFYSGYTWEQDLIKDDTTIYNNKHDFINQFFSDFDLKIFIPDEKIYSSDILSKLYALNAEQAQHIQEVKEDANSVNQQETIAENQNKDEEEAIDISQDEINVILAMRQAKENANNQTTSE